MSIFEQEKRRKKTFKVNHAEPGDFRMGYILLPFGYSYNSEWSGAKKGDVIKLWGGGEYPIYAVRKIKMSSPEADILSRIRYGITIKGILQRWRSNAKMEGHGSRVVSDEECLWVIYGLQDTGEVC